MRNATFLVVVAAFLVALPAPAEEAGSESHARLKAQLGTLPNLSAFLGGDEELERKFADGGFRQPGMQKNEWKVFDGLLGGGKLDPGGKQIRAELKKLPPEQWYYVIRLEEHRRNLAELSAGWFGNLVQGVGNMVRPEEAQLKALKCTDLGNTLIGNMEPVKGTGRTPSTFKGWESGLVTAKFREITLDEHSASCFRFAGSDGPVELVADAWADDLVPARVWWLKWDPKALSGLSTGKDVCGDNYEAFHEKRIEVYEAKLEQLQEPLREAGRRINAFNSPF